MLAKFSRPVIRTMKAKEVLSNYVRLSDLKPYGAKSGPSFNPIKISTANYHNAANLDSGIFVGGPSVQSVVLDAI